MVEKAEALAAVIERLSQTAAPRDRFHIITADSEIYRDLRVYGHDLFELVEWLHKEFGVQGYFDLSLYGPGEISSPLLRWLRSVLGLKEPQYESLKVGDLVSAIEVKRWPP